MKFTQFFLASTFLACLVIPTLSFADTHEASRSSNEVQIEKASSSEVTREWIIGTYYASPEVIRTVTIQSNPIIIEKIVEVEKFHTSAPIPVVLQKSGPEALTLLLLGIFLLGGGITLNKK